MNIVNYILWWELRRLLFNLILLGSSGILCLVLGFNPLLSEPGSGEYLLFITYLILIALANLAYALIYGLYYKKIKGRRQRLILFKRISLTAVILLLLYTIFIRIIMPGLLY